LHLTGDHIKVIDFQTATAGPPHYDLVSFLKDAYFVLSDAERSRLLQHYFDARSGLGSPVEDPVAFTHTFHLCGLQRNMQALAAFSFLGTHKKKIQFYAHIPTALGYLEKALCAVQDYPCLRATIDIIQEQAKDQPKS
jgi:aminoglycoside/choline kinase family phosphotransferase